MTQQFLTPFGQKIKAGRIAIRKAMWLLTIGSFLPLIMLVLMPPAFRDDITDAQGRINFAGMMVVLLVIGFGAAILDTLVITFGCRGGWNKIIMHSTHNQSTSIAILAFMMGFTYSMTVGASLIELGLALAK